MTQTDYLSQEKLDSVLKEWDAIDEYAYCIHDMDRDKNGMLKKPHYHIFLRFRGTAELNAIANKFGVPTNFISRCKRGAAATITYLTHANAPDKYQYSDDIVKANFGWIVVREKYMNNQKDFKDAQRYAQMIVSRIIKPYQLDEIPYDVYIKCAKTINRAFDYARMTANSPDRNMSVTYVYGETGVGKTVYAKKSAQELGLTPFISSADNDPFYGYQGQPFVVLDDFRPTIKIDQFIKLIDNYTNSSAQARYKNIDLSGCTEMYITSILPIDAFITKLVDGEYEDPNQVMRRIGKVIEITEGQANHFMWNGNRLVLIETENYSPEDYFGK